MLECGEVNMKILYVLPRDMHFGPSGATSIDLCCRNQISCSAYSGTTRVLASPIDDWFEGVDTQSFPAAADRSTRVRVAFAVKYARSVKPDLIVVQQHLPPAAGIAASVNIPVILQRHNFQRAYPKDTFLRRIRYSRKRGSYQLLAGMMHVSEACARQFGADWPDVTIPQTVVPNGMPVASWRPAKERTREILCVARSAPEKGVLEAAQALAAVLPTAPGWSGRFIFSAIHSYPDFHASVLATLAPLAGHVSVDVQRPYAEVQAACERAAIALVPSMCQEGFGRTALEAHAGGAALISSGSGGLREVSGDTALYLDEVSPDALVAAMRRLISDTQLRGDLAAAGRRRVERLYTADAVSGLADAFFEQVVDRARQPAGKPRESVAV